MERKLEVKDVRVVGVDISGDGDAWIDYKDAERDYSLPSLLDLLANNERIFLRVRQSIIYTNGSKGLPKVGPVYELTLVPVPPTRYIGGRVEQLADGKEKENASMSKLPE